MRKYKATKSPIGVLIPNGGNERITEIAVELGVDRHALLVYVLEDFIRRYDEGYRPETETRQVVVLKRGKRD